MADHQRERRPPTAGEERCPWALAGYEQHSGHPCVFQDDHEGRHEDEHGKDGGWKKIGGHAP